MTTARELVERGAAIGAASNAIDLVADLEEGKNSIFWVTQFPEDQHHTHSRELTRKMEVGDVGIEYYDGKKLIDKLALYDQWPEIDTDRALDEKNRWEAYLKVKKNREQFDRFFSSMK